ncbi:MAG: HAMP domain-containing sensor histidine kinase, partial [Sneathiella sp.]
FKDRRKLTETGLQFEYGELDTRLRTLQQINQILIDKGMVKETSNASEDNIIHSSDKQLARQEEILNKKTERNASIRPPSPPQPPNAPESSRTESNWISPNHRAETQVKRADDPAKSNWEENREKEAFIESKVEIGNFSLIEGSTTHLLAVRKIWMDGRKIIQGFAINKRELIEYTLIDMLSRVDFETPVMVKIDHNDGNLSAIIPKIEDNKKTFKLAEDDIDNLEEAFYFGKLHPPLEHVGLKFSTDKIPMGPTSALAIYLMAAVIMIVFVGMWIIYRLGLHQIKLNEERLNFVSAVSHELKTPLTSIIMYSDMLREGMVSDENKKKSYYDFIFFESERLGRLIENVLRLSKLGRQDQGIQLEYTTIGSTIDLIRSKVSTLVEKNGINFHIHLEDKTSAEMKILIDPDAFSQIVINLMDNAIKFSKTKDDTQQVIDVYFERLSAGSGKEQVRFSVRDYGPGIDKANSAKIFDLFYRAGNEMTRTTPGTGIGLSLVSELTAAMGG